MRAGDFLANPGNYRKHPTAQENVLTGVLDTVGWVQEVIINKTTGHMVDGHLRVKAALSRSEDEPVPYKVVELTEAEEALVLATYDPISAMAFNDEAVLKEVLALVPDHMYPLAAAVHAKKEGAQLVSFNATVHYRVVVECSDESQQQALCERLAGEGYRVRATGGES